MPDTASKVVEPYEDWLRRPDVNAVEAVCGFFGHDDPVHRTLRRIVKQLDELGVAYAVVGGMALIAHGFEQSTVDVDAVLKAADASRALVELNRRGYLRVKPQRVRDVETGVRVDFVVEGQYPGDGKPKPVAFPNPLEAGEIIDGIRYVRLPVLVDLKLASGMTNPGRLRDLADVQELIRVLKLPESFAEQLNPYVREKYLELWRAVQQDPNEHENGTM